MPGPTVPYVVKDPWLFTYFDQVDLDVIEIDALILPMRDLMAAAKSRILQERTALSDKSEIGPVSRNVAGNTPGGVLYSLDVVDQARILGVGFFNVLQWAVMKDLPVFLLSFPRMVEDRDYLLRTLWPLLEKHCTSPVACKAFDDVAFPEWVRIRDDSMLAPWATGASRERDGEALDRAALSERLREMSEERSALANQSDELAETIARMQGLQGRQQETIDLLKRQLDEVVPERDALVAERDTQGTELMSLRQEVVRLRSVTSGVKQDVDDGPETTMRRACRWVARKIHGISRRRSTPL